MNEEEIKQIIEQNPNLSYEEMRKQAIEADISKKDLAKAWDQAHDKKRSRILYVVWGTIIIVWLGAMITSGKAGSFMGIAFMNVLAALAAAVVIKLTLLTLSKKESTQFSYGSAFKMSLMFTFLYEALWVWTMLAVENRIIYQTMQLTTNIVTIVLAIIASIIIYTIINLIYTKLPKVLKKEITFAILFAIFGIPIILFGLFYVLVTGGIIGVAL